MDERRSSGRQKRKARDPQHLDFEVWPGLEQALRASSSAPAPEKKPSNKAARPEKHQPIKTAAPTGHKPQAEKPAARKSAAVKSSSAPAKRAKPRPKPKPKPSGGRGVDGGGGPSEHRRVFARIVEPQSANVGEGLAGLGKMLVTSYIARCAAIPDLVFTGPVPEALYPAAMGLLIKAVEESAPAAAAEHRRKSPPHRNTTLHARLADAPSVALVRPIVAHKFEVKSEAANGTTAMNGGAKRPLKPKAAPKAQAAVSPPVPAKQAAKRGVGREFEVEDFDGFEIAAFSSRP